MSPCTRLLVAGAVVSLALMGCPPSGNGTDSGVDAGADGGRVLTTHLVHFHRPLADYTGWKVAVTAGAAEASVDASGTDGWGAVFTLTPKAGEGTLTFALQNGSATDNSGTLSVDVSAGPTEVWVLSGLAKAITHTPYALPSATTAALYYQRPDMAYAGWGLHLWGDQVRNTSWAGALTPKGTDPDLGDAFEVPLEKGAPVGNCTAGKICLIMHSGDTKDPGPDMSWDPATLGNLVFLTSGSTVLSTVPRKPGSVDLSGAAAHLVSRSVVAFDARDAGSVELRWSLAADIKVSDATGVTGGQVIHLNRRDGGLGPELAGKAPVLASWQAYDVDPADLATIPQALKGQLVAVARKPDGSPQQATLVQTAWALDDLYATDAGLGPSFASVGGAPTVAVWAPTAQVPVKLHVYNADKSEVTGSPFTMTGNDAGVYSATGPAGWYGLFYKFEVQVFHPATGKVETLTTTDPYSTTLSTNSKYSQFLSLNDPATLPTGWSSLAKPPLAGPQDAVVVEGHVRDFSVFDTTVPQAHRGKFLAFTDTGSNGMKYLAGLADAGVTHLHVLPIFDLATIDEDPANRVDLDSKLSDACAKVGNTVPAAICSAAGTQTVLQAMQAAAGDATTQQAIAAGIQSLDSFNWGYDPLHYGAPEGSYASTAEGPARVLELRQMVMGLNQAGLRLVMDVVYNHTNASGVGEKSVLDKLVPGYYHRLDPVAGSVLTSTCCANTATEHAMMQRLMVETMVRWARDYKVDGFRWDLMGFHLKRNVLDVQAALNALTPGVDGVDGSKILLYGEGWDYGEVAANAIGENAVQRNMAGTGVGTFNDRIRDGIRGGGPFDNANDLRKNQGFATGQVYDPNEVAADMAATQGALDSADKYNTWVRIGMAGNLGSFRVYTADGYNSSGGSYGYGGVPTGYGALPWDSVNYCSAHDNQTLWDISQYKLPTGTPAIERARVQAVAMAPVALGQGLPFFHLADELLRSKSMDKNSYDSGDWFNRIDWTGATNGWASGLPMASNDQGNWIIIKPLIADTTTAVTQAAALQTSARFKELIRLRKSTPLLRLTTEAAIDKRVDFPNGGTGQVRGLLVMTVSDGTCAGADLDPARDGVVVLINATKAPASWTFAAAAGKTLTLSAIDAASADPVARGSTFESGTGKFTIPAHTVAVFEQPQSGAQGAGLPCNSR